MTNLLLHTTLMATALTLVSPLIFIRLATPINIARTTKLATLMSLIATAIFIESGLQTTTTNLTWTTPYFNLKISLMLDMYSMLFIPVALFITTSILDFTNWYMAHDPHKKKFSKYLLLFLTAMLTLTTANNMLQLFIGWEGVGIMSFLLIGWWHARNNANAAALEAVLYNRIGDIGLLLTLAWLAMNLNTWDMQQLFSHTYTPTLPLLGLILAATGKSAQFGLHPWLPAAMEGPTPVSALLHSSTMVVAGVFLLIRLHPLITTNTVALSTCLCLGAMTTTFAALCALAQNDIKKIIAFSTSSQLGLMMLTLGLNQPELAFLHVTTHAFFKALLFLCSGSIIHSLNDEQDIRKMGGIQKSLPLTAACLTLGSLALMGTPFLAGFYTKDTILEAMNTSSTNAWALTTTMIATAFTAAYSLRLIFFVQLNTPRHQVSTMQTETTLAQTRPLTHLATGSIIAGLLIATLTLPEKPQIMTMASTTKLAAILVTLLGLACAMDLVYYTNYTTPKKSTTTTTLSQLGFFNTLMHRHSPLNTMKLAQTGSLQLNDLLWYETLTPTTTKTTNIRLSNTLSSATTGLIKTHLTAHLLLLGLCLTTTYIYGVR
uniref:NADH-ubiquinone oxidoreductase chain 5 n=1 Tax=Cnemaspis limi TaxID=460617 RepID=K9JWW9_CNELI|nr:NADH dehydrogenase subunit 5 [Cnemaspis limi]ADY86105.1 NADH dehydrogenase subunit 5 [Cnemaspis limi]